MFQLITGWVISIIMAAKGFALLCVCAGVHVHVGHMCKCVCVCMCVLCWYMWMCVCENMCLWLYTTAIHLFYTSCIYLWVWTWTMSWFCFREEDKNYKFNMNALHSFLNDQISKSPGPAKFYNVQVFRYEVLYTSYTSVSIVCHILCIWIWRKFRVKELRTAWGQVHSM